MDAGTTVNGPRTRTTLYFKNKKGENPPL